MREEIYIKPIEGDAIFQKNTVSLGNRVLNGSDITFTACDKMDPEVNETANLFTALNLPTTLEEFGDYSDALSGTALEDLLAVKKFIAVEIPKESYGELIDGKTLHLKIPTINGPVNIYGSYYGFNSDLNAQHSDSNNFSALFGVEPTPENDFNTNIAYLFSNEVAKPKDRVMESTILKDSFSVSGTEKSVSVQLETGNLYRIDTLANKDIRTMVRAGGYPVDLGFDSALEAVGPFWKPKMNIDTLVFKNDSGTTQVVTLEVKTATVVSESEWGVWAPYRQYPATENGSGKRFAKINDVSTTLLVDKPVGVAYLDKGVIMIHNEYLVDNFDGSQGVVTKTADGRFVKMILPDDEAMVSFDTVVSEFVQNVTCLAMNEEFNQSTNPTFEENYPEGASSETSVYVTDIALWNKFGETIAIAKLPEPQAKNISKMAVYNIKLKL